ncbi:MAG: hypothetical protein HC853_17355 [Anaerolineae bacterium]|nr:hypothetical protein [Anaerolineae bacterium]
MSLFAVVGALVLALSACAAQGGARRTQPTPTPDPWQVAQTSGAPVQQPEANAIKSAISDAIANNANGLAQAMTLVPDTAEVVTFTDWARVKAGANAVDVTGASDTAKQSEVAKWLKEQTPFAAYGFSQIETHVKDWGWNSLDVLWEAATRVGDNPVYLLKLRDDVDLDAIKKHFEERKFSRFGYQGATVFAFNGSADWMNTTQRSIYTTAIFEDLKLLVMSYQPRNVQAILELNAKGGKALVDAESMKSLAAALGEKPSAFLAKASFACKTLDEMAKDIGLQPDALGKFKESFTTEPVHAYSAFGLGYDLEEGKTTGTVVLHYDKAEDAKADMGARQNDLKQGLSLANMKPYTEMLTLEKAELQGNDILLHVLPANNSPKTLWSMISRQDMAYARCPQAVQITSNAG